MAQFGGAVSWVQAACEGMIDGCTDGTWLLRGKRPQVKRSISSGASYFDESHTHGCHSRTHRRGPFCTLNAGFVKHILNMGSLGGGKVRS